MKLKTYLKETGQTLHVFGVKIGRNKSTVSRLVREDVMPNWDTVRAIKIATDGKVCETDWLEPAEAAE